MAASAPSAATPRLKPKVRTENRGEHRPTQTHSTTSKRFYVQQKAEFKMQTFCRFVVMAIIIRASAGACPDGGWVEFGGECYYFSTTEKNWVDASMDCDARGGRLATVDSEEVNTFITGKETDVWIGLYQTSYDGPYMWSDSSTATFRKWAFWEPNNMLLLPEFCVHIRSQKDWNDAICTLGKKYVCQQVKATGPCGDSGWLDNGGKCYRFIYEQRTWDDAEEACLNRGGVLASVQNEAENSFLTSRIWGDMWIGLRQGSNSAPYLWSDDTPLTYNNWAFWEPNNFLFGEPCVQIRTNGKWNDISCNLRYIFACERAQGAPVEEEDGEVTAAGCKFKGVVHPAGEVWVQPLREGRNKECTCADPLPSTWSAQNNCIGVCTSEGTKYYSGDTYKRVEDGIEYNCRCNDYGKERCK